jgi:type II secretory pathway pseudopilin PulG
MNITIHKNGQQLGPFSEAQVAEMLRSGKLGHEDLAWAPDMPDWKPLSSFSIFQTQSNQFPPPISGTSTAPSAVLKKNEPLSIWALVLGIISLVGCAFGGFLAGIPAVICGHIGLSRIKRQPSLGGRGMAIAGLITGYLGILSLPIAASLALPAITGAVDRGKAMQMLSNMRQICLAVQTAQLDGDTTGNPKLGFPAKAKIKSKAELKQMLVSEGYITAADLEKLKFNEISVANVSDEDPADTIFLKATMGKMVIIFRKGGDGAIYRTGQNTFSTDPPRSPAYLD